MFHQVLFAVFLFASAVCALPLYGEENDRAINDAGCGVSKVMAYDVEPYIVGGTAVQKGQYPWMISLLYMGMFHICGATIIDDKWLLCAAHCFMNSQSASLYTARAGRIYTSAYEPEAVDYKVDRIVVHEKWQSSTIKNDVALLKLKTPANFSSLYINRVCLPPSSTYVVDNKVARITGWGDMKNVTGKNMPTVMQQADITIKEASVCSASYGALYTHATQVCAKSSSTAVCSGDSGGPIHVKDDKGAWVQVGISSFVSSGGCLNEHPNVFTRVSAYLDWIKTTMAKYP